MSTLFLHIGTPKTGTSAIQAFLGMDKNKAVLENHGFSFPFFEDFRSEDDAVMVRNAHTLIFGVYQNRTDYDEHEDLRKAFWDKIKQLLDSGKNVILSDESIWHICLKMDGFFEDICKKVKNMGHELRIIVYLRRQDKLLQSYWRYKILIPRRHLSLSFEDYIESKRYSYFPLDYFSHLSDIATAVGGTNNVIVRVYEPAQFYGGEGNIVADFLHCLGLELTDEYTQADLKRNEGIDFACCEVKRRLNTIDFMQKTDMLRPYMVNISDKNREEGRYQAPSLFTKEAYEEFMSEYEESNRRTAEIFMHSEDGVLFHEPEKFMDKKPATMVKDKDRLLICAEIMDQMNTEIQQLKDELKKERTPSWKKVFRMAGKRIKGK